MCVRSDTQSGETNRDVGIWSRESFISGSSKKCRWLAIKRPELSDGFQEFLKVTFGGGLRVCDFLLIRLCSWQGLVSGIFAQLWSYHLLTWVETLAPAKKLRSYIVIYIPWGVYQNTPRLHYCFLTAFPLFLHSLPSFNQKLWFCPLESRETIGVWSLFPKNEKWVPQKAFSIHNLEEPHRVLFGFTPKFWSECIMIFFNCTFMLHVTVWNCQAYYLRHHR